MKNKVITIDGLNGTGKSTLAKELAKKFNFSYLSAGTIFRSLACFATENGLEPHQTPLIIHALNNMGFSVKSVDGETRAFLGERDVTEEIKKDEYAVFASKFSNNQFIQDQIRTVIRQTAEQTNLVVDGRDMGTVVFPNADAKIVLTATLEKRAERRSVEQGKPYEEVLQTFREIDERAKGGFYAPPEDALTIDTTDLTKGEVLSVAVDYVEDRIPNILSSQEDLNE